jgi:hypothetical protein
MTDKIFGRCNDCKFAKKCGGWEFVSCTHPKMPASHKKLAISGASRLKRQIPFATVKCVKYQASGVQLFGLYKGLG